MESIRKIGVVVVGLGIAGKVRVRDLKAETCGLRLKGVVSRRPVELEDVEILTFETALERPDVDAFMICTEPAKHEDFVRRALEKGKHVMVEYPLALTSQVAKDLFQLADAKGMVLHEENIALLSESYHIVSDKASQVEIKSVDYQLIGSYNGWIEDFEKTGLPFVPGVSGLQTMLSLFGDLRVVGGKLDRSDDGYSAYANLLTQNGKPINMKHARSKSKAVPRAKKAIYEFEDGEAIDIEKLPNHPRKIGLFMQDSENFYKEILAGKITDERKQQTIRSLELAEEIHSYYDMS